MLNKTLSLPLSTAALLVLTVLAVSCPNQFIRSWYDEPAPATVSVSDTCDIQLYYFTNPAAVGVPGGGSGSMADPALIAVTYPYGTGIPAGDGDITVFHNGASIEWGDWFAGGRLYTVTAESGAKKHYRVTTQEGTEPDACGIVLYYFTDPLSAPPLLYIGNLVLDNRSGDSPQQAFIINLIYPEGISFPVDDIQVLYNGAGIEEDPQWSYNGVSYSRGRREPGLLYRLREAQGYRR
jgi:hypothetical protein